MKEAIIVDTNGYFIDVMLVADEETGVTEIYETIEADSATETGPAVFEQRLVGYRVAIPVPPGLYKPRFDLAAWEASQAQQGPSEPVTDGEGNTAIPQPQQPEFAYWVEGLAPEEIEAIRTRPAEPDPMERLRAENEALKNRLQQAEAISAETSADLQAFMDHYFSNGGF